LLVSPEIQKHRMLVSADLAVMKKVIRLYQLVFLGVASSAIAPSQTLLAFIAAVPLGSDFKIRH